MSVPRLRFVRHRVKIYLPDVKSHIFIHKTCINFQKNILYINIYERRFYYKFHISHTGKYILRLFSWSTRLGLFPWISIWWIFGKVARLAQRKWSGRLLWIFKHVLLYKNQDYICKVCSVADPIFLDASSSSKLPRSTGWTLWQWLHVV